ncbi:MAG: hypothetical protein FWG45_01830 [Oscillospiraceae bacterium]|nr:hypothetical protein [Oscillospiraceae bacterium]
MPTNKNADLKQTYYKQLMLKHENEAAGINVIGLDKWLLETRSTMDCEDVAWVENQVKSWLEN